MRKNKWCCFFLLAAYTNIQTGSYRALNEFVYTLWREERKLKKEEKAKELLHKNYSIQGSFFSVEKFSLLGTTRTIDWHRGARDKEGPNHLRPCSDHQCHQKDSLCALTDYSCCIFFFPSNSAFRFSFFLLIGD